MAQTPLRFSCKGGYCDDMVRCSDMRGCQYKSSAQELRESLDLKFRVETLERIVKGISEQLDSALTRRVL